MINSPIVHWHHLGEQKPTLTISRKYNSYKTCLLVRPATLRPVTKKWIIDVRTMAIVATVLVLTLLLLIFLYERSRHVKWALVQGHIQETRIVPDHALQTKWGGQLTWKAEYKVSYSVAGREYAAWADSGIRADDEAGVRLLLPRSGLLCRVQYDLQKPAASVADCR